MDKKENLLKKWAPLVDNVNSKSIAVKTATILENQSKYLEEQPLEDVYDDLDVYEQALTKQLLLGKDCSNCFFSSYCKKEQKAKYQTCYSWKVVADFNNILSIVRLAFPSMISNNLFSVQQIAPPKDKPLYINYKYDDEEKD